MKIAQVAPLFESVPPRAYGGTERVVSYLTESLVAQGHEVTLFASGDSKTAAELMGVVERGLRLDPSTPDWVRAHICLVDRVFAQAHRFDAIHFHIDCLHYPLARRCPTPCVTTLHGRLDLPDLVPLHAQFDDHPVVSISNNQRVPLPHARWCATVYHGLPQSLYKFVPDPDDYFAFVGRISPEKRVDRAIEIAIACNTRLRIAAKVDPVDRAYFEREIQPLLNHPLIEYVGEIGDADKNEFIGRARLLLFPIDWPEPFGLVMIEAFACGTPVVAYDCGSVSEVVQHGASGYIVHNQSEAIEAARSIERIDRRHCREVFDRRFTAAKMASRYVDVYQSLIDARRDLVDDPVPLVHRNGDARTPRGGAALKQSTVSNPLRSIE
jgi:glycosyltransferase involved in cell wall biosynthesis